MAEYLPSIDDAEGARQSLIPSFLRDPFGILRRRRIWMFLALLAGALATTAFVRYYELRYTASATIQAR